MRKVVCMICRELKQCAKIDDYLIVCGECEQKEFVIVKKTITKKSESCIHRRTEILAQSANLSESFKDDLWDDEGVQIE